MLTLYNTLHKRKEVFKPLYPGKVGMYTCGPTVYGYIHIGNIRAYVMADLLRRLLGYEGYEVRAIKNITDVGHLTADDIAQGDSGEDKIEKRARAEHKTPEEIARFYEDYFRETEEQMNILPAHYFPRATSHIRQMISMIETLIERGHAYSVNGSVFLDVTSFPDYGELSGNTLEKLKVGARLEEHPDKRHAWDFALWLKAPADHLMKWDSPWGIGYPGWHIECSAMSTEYLGDSFDIHTGGEDNIFPHHEAEIVQTEGVTNKPFVRYWAHVRHLLVDGQKMSKSKGNFYTLEDIIEHGYTPMDFRMALIAAHYRTQMNFTWDAMKQARANFDTLENTWRRLREYAVAEGQPTDNATGVDVETIKTGFINALGDDINTPEALAIWLRVATESNRLMDTRVLGNTSAVIALWDTGAELLGFVFSASGTIPAHIHELARRRETARQEKDFVLADTLRDEIEQAGFTIEDTASGTKVRSA